MAVSRMMNTSFAEALWAPLKQDDLLIGQTPEGSHQDD
jgi:hypothetical protein